VIWPVEDGSVEAGCRQWALPCSIFRVAPAIGARVIELKTTPFGPIGRFRFWRLLPEGTDVGDPLQQVGKGRVALPSLAVFRTAPGAVKPKLVAVCRPSVGAHVTEP